MKVTLLNATENPEETICQAARNDYMSEFVGDKDFKTIMETIDGDTIIEKKETLISHLLQHGHFGPFEHVTATFAVEGISRSCMAQITRHRHASFDIQSMRYVSFDDVEPKAGEAVIEIPELGNAEIHGRNAEFSENIVEDESYIEERREDVYENAIKQSFDAYNELLELGVAPENARNILPIGSKVNMVFTVNARMLMHIADMRAAADAQWEIREMTNDILELAEEWCEITFEHYNTEMKGRKNRLAP